MEENENDIQPQNEGQFIRLFNNVRRNTELNANSKMVLSHIISYQLQGKEFYMSNERIGYEYGFSESTAARAVKLLEPYLNNRKEYVQPKKGEKVKTIRCLSVKDLTKWVASSVLSQTVVAPSEITPKVVRPNVMDFTKTKTMNEFLDLANTHFNEDGELENILNSNDIVLKHFEKLHLSNV